MRDKHRGSGDIPTAVSSFCIHATVVITYVSSNGSYGVEQAIAMMEDIETEVEGCSDSDSNK